MRKYRVLVLAMTVLSSVLAQPSTSAVESYSDEYGVYDYFGNHYRVQVMVRNTPYMHYIVSMDVDCSNVPDTPEAKMALQRLGLCGFGRGEAEITPSVVRERVCGTCGCLILKLFNSRSGWMHWHAEITSSIGPMVYASYSGSWSNLDTNGSGPVSGNSGIILTGHWSDDKPILTGAGFVYGKIDVATSVTAYGLTCRNVDVVWNYINIT